MEKVFGYILYKENESAKELSELDNQLAKLGVTDERLIFHELNTGQNKHLAQLKEIERRVKAGDTIVTTDYSRIFISPVHLTKILNFVRDNKLLLIVGDFKFDCRYKKFTDHSQGVCELLEILNQMNEDTSVKRHEASKDNGSILGRPKVTVSQLPEVFLKYYPYYDEGELKMKDFEMMTKMPRQTLYKYVRLMRAESQKN